MDLVVGSGPSGVAAASALLEAKREVTMLDIGREPPEAARDLATVLAAVSPADWTPLERKRLRGEPAGADPARKLAFGSDFAYLSPREAGLEQKGVRALVSGAKGGLSAVWGASVLPFPEDEIRDWPVDPSELRPHYERAAALLGVSGARDRLEPLFPYHAPPKEPLPLSLQGKAVLARLDGRAESLAAAGFTTGRARHAASGAACRNAGTCLSGCVYGAIWCASSAVDALSKRPGFRYVSNARAVGYELRDEGVRVHVAREGASRATFDGDRLFLALGPLATARLVCASLGPPPEPLALLTQPYFVLPVMLREKPAGAPEPGAHTLAQLFLELRDPAISPRLAHLQLYGWNEVMERKLPRLLRALAPRLMAFQAYLHSDHGVPVKVVPWGRGEDVKLELRAGTRAQAVAAARAVVKKLSAHGEELGFTSLTPLWRLGKPGEGNHVGGLFPMRSRPGPWETDRAGRLGGKGPVHLVDASVLPSLPATTFTYAVMANASRIATEASA